MTAPDFSLKDKENVEMILWEGQDSPILYVINHGTGKEKFEIDTPLKYTIAKDILTDKQFEVEKGKLPLVLEGRSVFVLHLS